MVQALVRLPFFIRHYDTELSEQRPLGFIYFLILGFEPLAERLRNDQNFHSTIFFSTLFGGIIGHWLGFAIATSFKTDVNRYPGL